MRLFINFAAVIFTGLLFLWVWLRVFGGPRNPQAPGQIRSTSPAPHPGAPIQPTNTALGAFN